MDKKYHVIESYIETSDRKYPCIDISATVAIPQYHEFDIDDMYIQDNQISVLSEFNKQSFNSNYHVRNLLLSMFLIIKYSMKYKSSDNQNMSLLNVGMRNINQKLIELFPNLAIYDEDTQNEYTFIISTKKTIIDNTRFKFGMFVINIDENDNFSFFSGQLLSVPFINKLDCCIGVFVNFSTTQVINYETELLKRYIINNKQRQAICIYYNPFIGRVVCDLKPGLQCTYNNMYVLTIARLYSMKNDLRDITNLPKRVSSIESIPEIFKIIDLIFKHEKKAVMINPEKFITDNIVKEVKPKNTNIDVQDMIYTDSTKSYFFINDSTLNVINYFINNPLKYKGTMFVFHTEGMINKLLIHNNGIISKNFKNIALERINKFILSDVELTPLRDSIENTPFLLITYSKLKQILFNIAKKHRDAVSAKLNSSFKFCYNIVFCNAEYIDTDVFICNSVIDNLRYHDADIPQLIYQTNGYIQKYNVSEIKIGRPPINHVTFVPSERNMYKFVAHRVEMYKNTNINEKDFIPVNVYNYSKIYTQMFGSLNTIIQFNDNEMVINKNKILYFKFLENNTAFRMSNCDTTELSFTGALFNAKTIYDPKLLVTQLLLNSIQIIELSFINQKTKTTLLKYVEDCIDTDHNDYVTLFRATKFKKKTHEMVEPFKSGFDKARDKGMSLFTFCIMAAIYQQYEEFVDWSRIKDVKNISLYEMKMIKDYIVSNDHKFGITDKLTNYCKIHHLDYDVMCHILTKLVSFNESKRCSNDKVYNFEEFLRRIDNEKILDIPSIAVGVTSKDGIKYEFPSNKQFISHNKVIPISYQIKQSRTIAVKVTIRTLTSFITIPV